MQLMLAMIGMVSCFLGLLYQLKIFSQIVLPDMEVNVVEGFG